MTGTPGSNSAWIRDGDRLSFPIDLHPDLFALARDQAQHRLRSLRARVHGFLHPSSLTLTQTRLSIFFPPGAVLPRHSPPTVPFRAFRDTVLLPVLQALCDCHEQEFAGLLPPTFAQGGGRLVAPPGWFLPRPPGPDHAARCQRDRGLVAEFLATELQRRPPARSNDERRQVEALLDALRSSPLSRLTQLVHADLAQAAQDALKTPPAPSFLRLLTEAELLERLTYVFSYRARPPRLGTTERILDLDPSFRDPHFPMLERLKPQDLWDQLLEESRTTPLLAPSLFLPNPLDHRLTKVPTVNWLGVHPTEPRLFVDPETTPLPAQGYVRLHDLGDLTLMRRKRAFVTFTGAHPTLFDILAAPPPARPFTGNRWARDDLEEAVLATEGVFVVQGPPGTGKTHLATEVVHRFLLRCPEGRVLVCAKEHFALDHIARKITAALQRSGVPIQGYRSVSAARLKRDPDSIDRTWLGPEVARRLAALHWDESAREWVALGEFQPENDERLTSLAKEAANLFFCTTLDQAMVEFLGSTSFDLVIVEEAGKCYPSELLHAACLGRTVLLIGDQCQLPPYQEQQTRDHLLVWQEVLRAAAEDSALHRDLDARFGETYQALRAFTSAQGPLSADRTAWLRPFEFLFDRLERRYFLDEQFRMEAPLSRTIGSVFYPKPFVHRKHELVEKGHLPARPLHEVVPERWDVPMLWIDVPHVTCDRDAGEDGDVRRNRRERDVLLAYLRCLRSGTPHPQIDLVILTPYRAQKELLLSSDELRRVCADLSATPFAQVVRTTDEYQGREAELTVLSLVRNNQAGRWGFMTAPERLNVMFSRTRFRQVVVGCGTQVERYQGPDRWLRDLWLAYQQEARDPACARIVTPTELRHG